MLQQHAKQVMLCNLEYSVLFALTNKCMQRSQQNAGTTNITYGTWPDRIIKVMQKASCKTSLLYTF